MAILVDGQRGVLQHHMPNPFDLQMADTLAWAIDILPPPPCSEVRRGPFQLFYQSGDIGCLGSAHEVSAKTGKDLQRLFIPGFEQLAHGRTGEQNQRGCVHLRS